MNFKAAVNTLGWNLRKASPYIAFGAGVISFGGAIYSAVKATTKLDPVLKSHEEFKGMIEDSIDGKEPSDLTKEEAKKYKKDTFDLNLATTGQIARLYAPTAALSALSLASFTFSVGILRGRYLGAVSALNATTAAFESYRSRVIEDHGAIYDYAYRNGLSVEEKEETVIDPETGKKKKEKKQELVGIPHAQFAYRFEKYQADTELGSTQWQEVGSYSYNYIQGIIEYAQAKLDSGQRVWLSDLLGEKELGFGENVGDGSERFAGWLPGDVIRCGLEDDAPLTKDVAAYLSGESPDVTLIFNPRPFMYAEVYGNYKMLRDDKVLEVDTRTGSIEKESDIPFSGPYVGEEAV